VPPVERITRTAPRAWAFRIRNLLRRAGLEVVPSAALEASLIALHRDRVFRRLGINCVIDVGARVGDYGRGLRRNAYTGRIVSFEPVSESFEALRRRSAKDALWDVHRLALGATDGFADINVTEHSDFSSFLTPTAYAAQEFADRPRVVRTETVEIRRLDGIAPTVLGGVDDPRVYLKTDTQGWDLQVLDGAAGCLDSVLALQSEVSMHPVYEGMPSFAEAIERIEALGFGVSGLFPVSVDSNLEVAEFDCIAIRHDAVRRGPPPGR
jgi:FkbM family methyltransferase